MAWTQADEDNLSKLKSIRASGVRSTAFGDRTVNYMSGEELDTEIARLEAQKARASVPPRPRQWAGYADKGL